MMMMMMMGMMFEGVSDIFVTYQDHHKRLRLAHLLPSPSVFCRLEFDLGFHWGAD